MSELKETLVQGPPSLLWKMPHVVGGKEEYSFEYLDLSPDFAKQVLCERISQLPGASVSSRIKGDNTISIASFW